MFSLLKTVLKGALYKPVKIAPKTQKQNSITLDTTLDVASAEFASLWQLAENEAILGNRENAKALLYKAMELQPSNPELLYQLGTIERKMKNYEEAYDNLLLAINYNSKYTPAYHQLFLLCCELKKFETAESFINKAIELEPNNATLYCDLGNMLVEQNKHEEALILYNYCITLSPDWGVAYNNIGNCHLRMQQYHTAEKYLLIAKALKMNNVQLHINLHYLYFSLGMFPRCYKYLKKGLAIYPDNDSLNWMHCWLLLMYKRFATGWSKYDVRFSSAGGVIMRDLPFSRWQGESLNDKRIVIIAEQGLGDQLMFSSCLLNLLDFTKTCIVECDPKLKGLFERSFPTIEFLGLQRQSDAAFLAALPEDVNCYAYLGDLPRWFRYDLTTFLPAKPYIKADPTKVNQWQQRLNSLGNGLKVGISWRGGIEKTRSFFRTIPLNNWKPIFEIPGVHFINLQYGECEQELIEAKNLYSIDIHHWEQAIADYDETAALVSALDLVISVCTSVIHLSGSLGQQTWVMVPCSPEWRYLALDQSMPWYQNVRLYRQSQFGDWGATLAEVAQELTALTNQS